MWCRHFSHYQSTNLDSLYCCFYTRLLLPLPLSNTRLNYNSILLCARHAGYQKMSNNTPKLQAFITKKQTTQTTPKVQQIMYQCVNYSGVPTTVGLPPLLLLRHQLFQGETFLHLFSHCLFLRKKKHENSSVCMCW